MLTEEMSVQGSWLFRRRSYVPIALLALLLPPSLLGLSWPFGSYEIHQVWEALCLLISAGGLLIRCVTVGFVPVGTSGRGTSNQSADVLNTTGMYSVVRHPLYLGNYLVGLGVTMVWFDWWAPVIYSLCFWLYYERIMIAEERFLNERYGERFRHWAKNTPAFLPIHLVDWKRPALSFSIRSTIRREYSTLFLVVILYAGMEAIENYWVAGRVGVGAAWGWALICAITAYLLLSILKKRTGVLKVHGR